MGKFFQFETIEIFCRAGVITGDAEILFYLTEGYYCQQDEAAKEA